MKITKIAAVAALLLCVLLTVAAAGCTGSTAQSVVGNMTVAIDSNLKEPMTDIVVAFDAKYVNVGISYNFGESAELANKIVNGTLEVDAFVSLNAADIQRVTEEKNIDTFNATTLPCSVYVTADTQGVVPIAFVSFMSSTDGKAIFKRYGHTASQ